MLVKCFLPSGVSSSNECSVMFHREQFSWFSRERIYWTREGEREREVGRKRGRLEEGEGVCVCVCVCVCGGGGGGGGRKEWEGRGRCREEGEAGRKWRWVKRQSTSVALCTWCMGYCSGIPCSRHCLMKSNTTCL